MSKPFTVTEDDGVTFYKVHGFWSGRTVSIYKPSTARDNYDIRYSTLGGRDKDEVKSDLEAMKNFHAALGHAIETVEGLESE